MGKIADTLQKKRELEADTALLNARRLHSEMQTRLRHAQAILHSDINELLDTLLSAASRFEDMADQMDKDEKYRPTAFMRASAERCREAVSLFRKSSSPAQG